MPRGVRRVSKLDFQCFAGVLSAHHSCLTSKGRINYTKLRRKYNAVHGFQDSYCSAHLSKMHLELQLSLVSAVQIPTYFVKPDLLSVSVGALISQFIIKAYGFYFPTNTYPRKLAKENQFYHTGKYWFRLKNLKMLSRSASGQYLGLSASTTPHAVLYTKWQDAFALGAMCEG